MLTSELLFDGDLVRVADVACAAPASPCGGEEATSAPEVVLPLRGVFEVRRGRRVSVFADANTALLLGADDPYRVAHPVDGGDRCLALAFRPELIEEAFGGVGSRHALVDARARLNALELTSAMRGGGFDALALEEGALALLSALARERPIRSDARVESVRCLLAAAPAAPWRLASVASAVHVSPFHLARQFRASAGESIGGYLTRLRLGLALERLAGGEEDLGRLALGLGFASHSHFSARFRAAFGTTPSAARGRLAELRTIVTVAGGPPA